MGNCREIAETRGESLDLQDGFLARELPVHQGGVRHEAPQDGRVDGERGEGHLQDHGGQGLHLRGVQERKRHLQLSLERTEVKKWLAQILEILMAERAKDQRNTEMGKLDTLIKKHEELIPNVQKTAVMVDLYWKCYAYGDELKPHVEFLDGIMLSSTRDIAPSCVENVDELIERQEKSLAQLDAKRNIVTDLIAKGKVILQNPDKPKFLEANVKRIQDGWEDTKNKATDRLTLLTETKNAFIGYAEDSETVAREFDGAEEEIKKVKKIFNLEAANADLKKRQDIYKRSDNTISELFSSINANYKTMCITIPDDKKKVLAKEIKAVEEKLEVAGRFKATVAKIEELVAALTDFDNSH